MHSVFKKGNGCYIGVNRMIYRTLYNTSIILYFGQSMNSANISWKAAHRYILVHTRDSSNDIDNWSW